MSIQWRLWTAAQSSRSLGKFVAWRKIGFPRPISLRWRHGLECDWNGFGDVCVLILAEFVFSEFIQVRLVADCEFQDCDAGIIVQYDIRSDRLFEDWVSIVECRKWKWKVDCQALICRYVLIDPFCNLLKTFVVPLDSQFESRCLSGLGTLLHFALSESVGSCCSSWSASTKRNQKSGSNNNHNYNNTICHMFIAVLRSSHLIVNEFHLYIILNFQPK